MTQYVYTYIIYIPSSVTTGDISLPNYENDSDFHTSYDHVLTDINDLYGIKIQFTDGCNILISESTNEIISNTKYNNQEDKDFQPHDNVMCVYKYNSYRFSWAEEFVEGDFSIEIIRLPMPNLQPESHKNKPLCNDTTTNNNVVTYNLTPDDLIDENDPYMICRFDKIYVNGILKFKNYAIILTCSNLEELKTHYDKFTDLTPDEFNQLIIPCNPGTAEKNTYVYHLHVMQNLCHCNDQSNY